MDLNIEQMKELIELFEDSDLSEISVRQDDFQVTLKKNSLGEPKVRSAKKASQTELKGEIEKEAAETEPEDADRETSESQAESTKNQTAITSPMVGTFYRSPSPEEPVYVEMGDRIEEGDTVCIIEAMKVMNEVKADQSGEITEICVEDGDSVEYGQELFKLAPPAQGN